MDGPRVTVARRRRRWASLLFVVSLAGCPQTQTEVRAAAPVEAAPQGSPACPAPAEASAGSLATPARTQGALDGAGVVLVVLDGVRVDEVFDPSAPSRLPNLYEAIASRGVAIGAPGHGAPMVASGPNYVSLPGYAEILTGRRRTACRDNGCSAAGAPTLLDDVGADGALFSSWERIARVAWTKEPRAVASPGRGPVAGEDALRADPGLAALLAEGLRADPFPGYGAFRPDRFTAELALRYLELAAPRFLFLGLGEPDEYAHRGDYQGYRTSLEAADGVIGRLLALTDRLKERGRETSVLITVDHGRAKDFRFHGAAYPESRRVWLVATGPEVKSRGYAEPARPSRLADIAWTIRRLLGVPTGEGEGRSELGIPLGAEGDASQAISLLAK